MNIAVLLYANAPSNPDTMPATWPCMVLEIGESVELPGPEWVLMDQASYAQYLIDHQEEYAAWKASRNAALAPAKVISSIQTTLKVPVSIFIEHLMTLMAAENISNGITQQGKTGTLVGIFSHKVLLTGNPYPISILDTLHAKSLSETVRLIDYFIENIAEYEVPTFFTVARLQTFKTRIANFIATGAM